MGRFTGKPNEGGGQDDRFGPGATARNYGFDRMAIPTANGSTRYLTRQQFEDLPLAERVALLLNTKVRFLKGEQEIPAREALRRS